MKSTKSTAKVGASKDTTKSMDRHGVTTFSRWGVEQPVAGYKDIVASRKMFPSASMDPLLSATKRIPPSFSPLSLFFTFVTCPFPHLSRSQSFFLIYPIYTLHFLHSQFTILIQIIPTSMNQNFSIASIQVESEIVLSLILKLLIIYSTNVYYPIRTYVKTKDSTFANLSKI